MKIRHSGTGYRLPEGFSRCGETGYVVLESRQGCGGANASSLIDYFNYIADSDSLSTTPFPSWYTVDRFGSPGSHVVADHSGLVIGYGKPFPSGPSGGDNYFTINCANLGTLGQQRAQCTWYSTGIFAGIKWGNGGPMVLMSRDGSNRPQGYMINAHSQIGGLGAGNMLVDVILISGGTTTTLGSYSTGAAPDALPHVLRLDCTFEGGGVNRLKAYLDGVERVNVTDSTIAQSGIPGWHLGGTVDTAGSATIDQGQLSHYLAQAL